MTVPANIGGQHFTVHLAKVEGVRTFAGVCMGLCFLVGASTTGLLRFTVWANY
jgi:hypothetical protein